MAPRFFARMETRSEWNKRGALQSWSSARLNEVFFRVDWLLPRARCQTKSKRVFANDEASNIGASIGGSHLTWSKELSFRLNTAWACRSRVVLKKGHVPSQLFVLSDTYLNVYKNRLPTQNQTVAKLKPTGHGWAWLHVIEEREASSVMALFNSVPSKYQYCKNYHYH